MNLKKLLTTIGLLAVSVPTSLSVVACGGGPNQTDNNTEKIIKSIDKITDLKINITGNQTNETVFKILTNSKIGLAEIISQNKDISNFKKELFQLDTMNVFLDKEGKIKIDETTKIATTTYYFKYSYNNKKNNILIPVTIVNKEQAVVDAIKKASYTQTVKIDSNVIDLKKTITTSFIKDKLSPEIRKDFTDDLFNIEQINNNENKEIIDNDLKTAGQIEGKIIYNYGSLKKQEAKLTITISMTDEKIINEIKAVTDYKITVEANSKVTDLKDSITPKFIKDKLSTNIQKEFKDTSFSLSKIMNGANDLNNSDLTTPGLINAVIKFKYNTNEGQAQLAITVNQIDISAADVSEVNFQATNSTIDELTKKFTVEEILKNEDFWDAITTKVNNETIANNKNNYEVKGIFTDPEGTIPAKDEDSTADETILYIKVEGKGQLTGQVIVKLNIILEENI